MTCPHCTHSKAVKVGKTSGGYQRYKCSFCGKTFSDSPNTRGRPTEGDQPLTKAQIQARWRAKGK